MTGKTNMVTGIETKRSNMFSYCYEYIIAANGELVLAAFPRLFQFSVGFQLLSSWNKRTLAAQKNDTSLRSKSHV